MNKVIKIYSTIVGALLVVSSFLFSPIMMIVCLLTGGSIIAANILSAAKIDKKKLKSKRHKKVSQLQSQVIKLQSSSEKPKPIQEISVQNPKKVQPRKPEISVVTQETPIVQKLQKAPIRNEQRQQSVKVIKKSGITTEILLSKKYDNIPEIKESLINLYLMRYSPIYSNSKVYFYDNVAVPKNFIKEAEIISDGVGTSSIKFKMKDNGTIIYDAHLNKNAVNMFIKNCQMSNIITRGELE